MTQDIKKLRQEAQRRAERGIKYLTIGMTLLLIASIVLTSCNTRRIAHTPTRREINKSMKHSTWMYSTPYIRTTPILTVDASHK